MHSVRAQIPRRGGIMGASPSPLSHSYSLGGSSDAAVHCLCVQQLVAIIGAV